MKKIVQITDSHLGNSYGDTLLSMNADEGLADVLETVVEQQHSIDLVLCTGDISNNANLSAYQRFYTMIRDNLMTPMAWVPGNHDHADLMEALVQNSSRRVIDLGKWALILLDSHVVGETHGHFSPIELSFLEKALIDNQDKHIMISFHHQPVPIGSEWMDNYIIKNAYDFWKVLEPFENIKGIVWGHIHQEFDEQHQGIRLLSTPSTCIQFKPYEKNFMLDNLMPGYRWLELYDDGEIKTGVERVAEKDYGIDFESSGY